MDMKMVCFSKGLSFYHFPTLPNWVSCLEIIRKTVKGLENQRPETIAEKSFLHNGVQLGHFG